jgi:hypothetical protein
MSLNGVTVPATLLRPGSIFNRAGDDKIQGTSLSHGAPGRLFLRKIFRLEQPHVPPALQS